VNILEEILYELDYIINWQEHDPHSGDNPDELISSMQECAVRARAILVKEITPDAFKKPTRKTIKGRIQKKVAKKKAVKKHPWLKHPVPKKKVKRQ
jgi:hypothetical protein